MCKILITVVDKPGMCLVCKTGMGKMWACRFYFLTRRGAILCAMLVCRRLAELFSMGCIRNGRRIIV
jgi:hypothetical protein